LKLSNLNEWLTLGANVAVLTGILFLAYEIRQNTQTLISETYQERTTQLIETASWVADRDELLSALAAINYIDTACPPDVELILNLTSKEKIALRHWTIANYLRLADIVTQYENGAIDREYAIGTVVPLLSWYLPWLEFFEAPQANVLRRTMETYDVVMRDPPERCVSQMFLFE